MKLAKTELKGWRLWAFEAGAIAFILIPGSSVLLLVATALMALFRKFGHSGLLTHSTH